MKINEEKKRLLINKIVNISKYFKIIILLNIIQNILLKFTIFFQ